MGDSPLQVWWEDRSADDLVDSPKSSFQNYGTFPKSTVNGGPISDTVMVYWWHLDCPSIIILSFMRVYIPLYCVSRKTFII